MMIYTISAVIIVLLGLKIIFSTIQIHALILYMLEKIIYHQQKKNLNNIVLSGYYLGLGRNKIRFNYFTSNIFSNCDK